MKKIILSVLGLLLVVAIGIAVWVVFFWQPGPAYDEVSYLEQPEVTTLENELVMTLTLTGNPNETAPEAIGKLYDAYMAAGGSWNDDVAPRARWDIDALTKDRATWEGVYAMPLPEDVTTLPDSADDRITLTTWKYGKVAQVLHVGSYENETATVDSLKQYMEDNKLKIVGKHEEVYLKGPTMFGFGSEDKYLTLIRYRVESK